MTLKPGDLVRLKLAQTWHIEVEAWDFRGLALTFKQGTILEVIAVNQDNLQRFWCPAHRQFISALSQNFNYERFEKISL